MENGDFGKIRNAAKAYGEGMQSHGARHYREVFGFMRSLRKLSPSIFSDEIEANSQRIELLTKIGNKRFDLLKRASESYELKYIATHPDSFYEWLEKASLQKNDDVTSQGLASVLDFIETGIRGDPAIQAVFRGEGELLNQSIKMRRFIDRVSFMRALRAYASEKIEPSRNAE